MKRIIILITLIFLISGCEDNRFSKLKDKGYSEEIINKISNLKEENQELFLEDNKRLDEVIVSDNFKEEYLDYYLKYDFDVETINYLIENNLLNDANYQDIKKLMNDNWFMLKNLDKYLYYLDILDFDTRSLVEYVNAKAYKKAYEEYEMADLTKDTLVIASKIYSLGDYVPSDLVEVEEEYRVQANNYLREVAYAAYKEMITDARNIGLDFYISTSYRSYDYQSYFYNMYLDQYQDQAYVDTFSARPGFSDHQTGLTCDIRQKIGDFSSVKDSDEMNWLKDNSYKYGFILRYPKGKDLITGYEYEWWHFRYVGKDAAKIIYDNNLTYDEYYAYYVE